MRRSKENLSRFEILGTEIVDIGKRLCEENYIRASLPNRSVTPRRTALYGPDSSGDIGTEIEFGSRQENSIL
jgi:hypothetical protein